MEGMRKFCAGAYLVFPSLKQFHKQHNWDLHVSVLNITLLTYA